MDSFRALNESPRLPHLEELKLLCPTLRRVLDFFQLHHLQNLRSLAVNAPSLVATPQFLIEMGRLMGQEGMRWGLRTSGSRLSSPPC